MEGLFEQVDLVQLGIGNLDASGVRAAIEFGPNAEASGGARGANELDDGLVIDERPSAPVLGDVAEHPMLDLVPLRGARGEMRDPDRETGGVGELLKLDLEQPRAVAVAA